MDLLVNLKLLLKIYGDGKQTRSFQYVDDLVEGLILLMNGNYSKPVNLGNSAEYSIESLAFIIRDLIGSCFNNLFIYPRMSKLTNHLLRKQQYN